MDAFHVLSLKINNEGLTQAPIKENREGASGIPGNNHPGSDQETQYGDHDSTAQLANQS